MRALEDDKYIKQTRCYLPEAKELFGPLSMRALEDDKYIRQTRGYLPEAEVAFIDEIFKANSAILNTLLTLVNERLFDNGSERVKVPLLSVVGASNELPESEELDALYDRFLVRREVKQVSASGVAEMLTIYSSTPKEWSALDAKLTREDITQCKKEAVPLPVIQLVTDLNHSHSHKLNLSHNHGHNCIFKRKHTVYRNLIHSSTTPTTTAITSTSAPMITPNPNPQVPPSVIQLVTDLRTYLQEKIEPPIYVSDRRLVKSVQLLQVAAYCNGRNTVTEYDALLLQHVLWQRPEQIQYLFLVHGTVVTIVLAIQYLLSGLFSRTCRFIGNPVKVVEIQNEVTQLRHVLVDRYIQVAQNLEGGFPAVLNNIWLGRDESQAVATALQPKLTKTQASIETLMFDVILLEVALNSGCEAVALANLMPRYWADFIRNSDMSEV
eukprot:gene23710-9251_t